MTGGSSFDLQMLLIERAESLQVEAEELLLGLRSYHPQTPAPASNENLSTKLPSAEKNNVYVEPEPSHKVSAFATESSSKMCPASHQ